MTQINLTSQSEIRRKQVETNLSNFDIATTPLVTVYNNLTNQNKSTALSALSNWNFAASSPTVGRENALFVAICLLYFMVAYLIHKD